jgi:thioredoxin-dependent peroxiredoxin
MRAIFAGLALAVAASSASGALPQGKRAPNFVTTGVVGGKAFRLDLNQQLRNGPVVLYFFPKAFTKGCTLEAHAFSEAAGEFRKAGARVIGLSADNIDTLKKFSVEECRSAFPVGRASPELIREYDVVWKEQKGLTTRTSYVIDRNGRIVMVHDDLDWSQHVAKTLAAVKALKR